MGQCNSCNAEYDDDTSTFADATKAPEKALIGTPKPREAPRIRKLNGGKTKPKIKAPSFNISHPIGTPYVEPGVHTLDLKLEPLYCTITSVTSIKKTKCGDFFSGRHVRNFTQT